MNLLDHLKACLKIQRKRIDQRADWQVAVLGICSAIPALYWALTLKDITPHLIQATNQTGITLQASTMWLFVGLAGVQIWFFGCVAKKCGDTLYKRMFDA
jgi:hypothetical protein